MGVCAELMLARAWAVRDACGVAGGGMRADHGSRLGRACAHTLARPLGKGCECGARVCLAIRVELLPPIERAREPRRDLRVQRIERNDLIGAESVSRAIGCVEA